MKPGKRRIYESPPHREGAWRADRPAETVDAGPPLGDRFGRQGPDQGYALRLAAGFADKIVLGEGEHLDDAVAGCVAVAMKRASLFGRAPVVHDLTAAFTIWGFLDESPASELATVRKRMFEEVSSDHHYLERRQVVDAVPDDALRQPHAAIAATHAKDWRSLLALPADSGH
jgi:hypothetical protein